MYKSIGPDEFCRSLSDYFSIEGGQALYNFLEETYSGKYLFDPVKISTEYEEVELQDLRIFYGHTDGYYNDEEFLAKVVEPKATYCARLKNGKYLHRP